MSKALVIGGLGFIGHHLVRKMHDDVFDCTVIDHCAPYTAKGIYFLRKEHIKDVSFIDLPVTEVQESDLTSEYDTVIHLGSYPNIKEIERNPSLGISSLTHGVFHSLNLAKSVNAKRFIYSASSMVYGDFKQDPCPETHPRDPKSIYGIYKKAAEDLVMTRCQQYGIEYTIIRPIAVYGPRDNSKRVVSKFYNLALQNKALPVRGDVALDATYVMDTVQGFFKAAKSDHSNMVFNIGSGQCTSLLEVAETIIELVGKGTIQQMPADPLYPTRGALDITQARTYLGYNPQYDIKKGLKAHDTFYRFAGTIPGV